MASLSNYLEQELANHILRTATYSKPSIVAIALCAGVPTETDTGATIPELPNANGYVRYGIGAPNNNHFNPHGVAGPADNTSGISFPPCSTADWGWVSGIAIVDSTTHGAGNLLFYAALPVAKYITVSDTFSIPSGDLNFTFA